MTLSWRRFRTALIPILVAMAILLPLLLPAAAYAVDADGDGVPAGVDQYDNNTSKVTDVPAALADLEGNLKVWFDFADATFIVQNSGIETVYDKSGNRHHATQSDSGKRPELLTSLNGMTSAVFNGSTDTLSTGATPTLEQPMTIVFVGKFDDTGNWQYAYDGSSFGASNSYGNGGNDPTPPTSDMMFYYADTHRYVTVPRPFDPHVNITIRNGASSQLYHNGILMDESDIGGGSIGDLILGSRGNGENPMTGYISEILIFDKVLSASELQTVNLYIAEKWNVSDDDADMDMDGVLKSGDLFDTDPDKVVNFPSEIQAVSANLFAWYDGKSSTANVNSDNLIDKWYDISGSKHHLTPKDSSTRPSYGATALNGLGGLSFNNKLLQLKDSTFYTPSSKTGVTIIMVCDPNNSFTGSPTMTLDYGSYPSNGFGFSVVPGFLGAYTPSAANGLDLSSGVNSVNLNGPLVVSYVIRFEQTQSLYVNGVRYLHGNIPDLSALDDPEINHSSPDLDFSGPLSIGRRSQTFNSNLSYFIGVIGDVLIFQEALSDIDRRNLEEFLMRKYNFGETVYIDTTLTTWGSGTDTSPFHTFEYGLQSVLTGGTLLLKSDVSGISNLSVTKSVTIQSDSETPRNITD